MHTKLRKINALLAVSACGAFAAALAGCTPATSDTAASDEHVLQWEAHRVADEHTIEFEVTTGVPECNTLRHVAREEAGSIYVAIVNGVPHDAPDACPLAAVTETVKITTKAPASTLKVLPLPEAEAGLQK